MELSGSVLDRVFLEQDYFNNANPVEQEESKNDESKEQSMVKTSQDGRIQNSSSSFPLTLERMNFSQESQDDSNQENNPDFFEGKIPELIEKNGQKPKSVCVNILKDSTTSNFFTQVGQPKFSNDVNQKGNDFENLLHYLKASQQGENIGELYLWEKILCSLKSLH